MPVSGRLDARLVPVYAREWREMAPVLRWRERVAPSTFPTYFGYLLRLCLGILFKFQHLAAMKST